MLEISSNPFQNSFMTLLRVSHVACATIHSILKVRKSIAGKIKEYPDNTCIVEVSCSWRSIKDFNKRLLSSGSPSRSHVARIKTNCLDILINEASLSHLNKTGLRVTS